MEFENYDLNVWHLFIDSTKSSLKCVLMHNGNKLGSLPIAHSTKVKEEYYILRYGENKVHGT